MARAEVFFLMEPSQMGKFAVRVTLVDSRGNIVCHGFKFIVFLARGQIAAPL
jgi:hypothetical protein